MTNARYHAAILKLLEAPEPRSISRQMSRSREKRLKDVREEEAKFATWALKRVLQGEFRENYYKLLKQYEEENGRMVKN